MAGSVIARSEDLLTIIVQNLLSSPSDTWISKCRMLLSLSQVSKAFHGTCMQEKFWFLVARGLWPKRVGKMVGIDLSLLEILKEQYHRKEFRGFGFGHEAWRATPEAAALKAKIEDQERIHQSFYASIPRAIFDERETSWFEFTRQLVQTEKPCMQCGQPFREMKNDSLSCRFHNRGGGTVFDWTDDDFVYRAHTCCNAHEGAPGCQRGPHHAEDGILSPEGAAKDYSTAHM